jgi:heme exporter protein D
MTGMAILAVCSVIFTVIFTVASTVMIVRDMRDKAARRRRLARWTKEGLR